jgi:DNA-binding ferritin-like protein
VERCIVNVDTNLLWTYTHLLIIYRVAERIRNLNGKSLGTYSKYLENGRIKESHGEYPNDITMISNLLANHEQVIRILRMGQTGVKMNMVNMIWVQTTS